MAGGLPPRFCFLNDVTVKRKKLPPQVKSLVTGSMAGELNGLKDQELILFSEIVFYASVNIYQAPTVCEVLFWVRGIQ